MFYYNIIVLGIPLYIGDSDIAKSIRWEAITQMEDFKLFGVLWQLIAAKQNLKEL